MRRSRRTVDKVDADGIGDHDEGGDAPARGGVRRRRVEHDIVLPLAPHARLELAYGALLYLDLLIYADLTCGRRGARWAVKHAADDREVRWETKPNPDRRGQRACDPPSVRGTITLGR